MSNKNIKQYARQFYAEMTITRHYGGQSVSFTLGENVTARSGGDRVKAFDSLRINLEHQIEYYEENNLGNIRPPVIGDMPGGSKSQEWFDIEQVRVEHQGGNKIIRLSGGDWSKFGCPVYEDNPGFEHFDQFDLGYHDVTAHKWRAKAEIVNGSPKRVVAIDLHE